MKEHSALIAMSGGVDSAVAASVMLAAGWRCQGATMRLRGESLCPGQGCGGQEDAEMAEKTADVLGIPFTVIDLTDTFRQRVVDKFVRVYETGGTPNPCVDCNRYLKFGALLEWAGEQGLECLVTGHYVRSGFNAATGLWELKKGLDPDKDQSYFLHMLTQAQLARLRFPLGDMTKEEVRRRAGELGLPNAQKPDSQDICFVPDGDYAAFLERYTGRSFAGGDFVDGAGRPLGRHRGAARYTLGQRRGLDLPMGERVYVVDKDMEKNTVTVGPESALYSRTVRVEGMNWIAGRPPEDTVRVTAKTRYRQTGQWAAATPEGEGAVTLVFDQPQRAVTPGQAAVLYDGDTVLGGGTIQRAG